VIEYILFYHFISFDFFYKRYLFYKAKVSKNFINTISFLKDQGREHFNGKTFGKYKQFVNAFDKLE